MAKVKRRVAGCAGLVEGGGVGGKRKKKARTVGSVWKPRQKTETDEGEVEGEGHGPH